MRLRLLLVIFLFSLVSMQMNTGRLAIPRVRAVVQGCTPPLYQGSPSSCSVISLHWLYRDSPTLIDHYEIYRYGVKIADAPADALGYSDPVGCSFSARYTIKQVMKSGASCSTETTGDPPHTRFCDLCTNGKPVLNVVSSASFTAPVMFGSIATIFANASQPLTSATAAADTLPLPTVLAGTQIFVDDLPAALFYVSPTQINFLIPNTRNGAPGIVVMGANGERTEGVAFAGPNPAIFTANNSGNGVAAGLITSDGNNYQRIFDDQANAVPVSVSQGSQPNYLVLFGTSIRNQGEVTVKIGGRIATVTYAGPHPTLPGVDQINVQIPQSLRGIGETSINVLAGGLPANYSVVNIGY